MENDWSNSAQFPTGRQPSWAPQAQKSDKHRAPLQQIVRSQAAATDSREKPFCPSRPAPVARVPRPSSAAPVQTGRVHHYPDVPTSLPAVHGKQPEGRIDSDALYIHTQEDSRDSSPILERPTLAALPPALPSASPDWGACFEPLAAFSTADPTAVAHKARQSHPGRDVSGGNQGLLQDVPAGKKLSSLEAVLLKSGSDQERLLMRTLTDTQKQRELAETALAATWVDPMCDDLPAVLGRNSNPGELVNMPSTMEEKLANHKDQRKQAEVDLDGVPNEQQRLVSEMQLRCAELSRMDDEIWQRQQEQEQRRSTSSSSRSIEDQSQLRSISAQATLHRGGIDSDHQQDRDVLVLRMQLQEKAKLVDKMHGLLRSTSGAGRVAGMEELIEEATSELEHIHEKVTAAKQRQLELELQERDSRREMVKHQAVASEAKQSASAVMEAAAAAKAQRARDERAADQARAEQQAAEVLLRSLQQDVDEARMQKATLQGGILEAQAERARAASAVQGECANAEQKLGELKRTVAEAEAEAEAELASTQQRLKDSQSQLAGAEIELLRVQQRLSETQSSAIAAEADLADLQQRLTPTRKQVTAAEAVLLSTEQQLSETEERTALANDRLASTEHRLAEEQRTAAIASADLEAVRKHLNEIQGRVTEAQTELRLAQDLLAEMELRKEARAAEIEDLQRKAAKAKATLQKLEEVFAETKDKTASAEGRHAEAHKQLATVGANLRTKQQEVAKLKQDAEGARKELEASKHELAGTQKELATAQQEHECTQSTMATAQSELAGIRIELEAARLELDEAQKQAAACKAELVETRAKLAGEQHMLSKAQSEVAAAKLALEATNRQQMRAQELAAGAEIELMNMRNRLREAQSLEAASQRELSTSRSDLREMQRKAVEAQRELHARARELQGLEHAQAAARADLGGLQRKLTEGARLAGLQQEMICGGQDLREQPSHQGPLTPAAQASNRSYRSPAQHPGYQPGSMSRELESLGAGLHSRPDQDLLAREKEAEKLQRELDGLRAELHQCKDKVSEEHIKLADLHSEARLLRQRNQEAADALQGQLQDRISPLNVQAAKRQRVSSRPSEWPQPSIVRELEWRVEDLSAQLSSAERRARVAEDRAADPLRDVQLALEQADQDRQALSKDLWSEQQQRMDAEVKLQQALRRMNATEAEAHEASNRLEDREKAHALIVQQLASEQSRCSAAEKSAAALSEKLAAACLAYEEAGEKLLRMDASHCRLEGRLQELIADHRALQREHAALSECHKHLQEDYQGALQARDAASGEQGTLEYELERLLQRHKQARAAQRAAERDLRDCQAGREEAEHALIDAQATLADAAAKADAAAAALAAEQAAHTLTETRLQEANESLQCARAEAAEATRRNAAKAGDLQEAAAAAEDAVERLRADNRSLQHSLDALRGSLKKAHDTREAAELRAFEGEARLAAVLEDPPFRDTSTPARGRNLAEDLTRVSSPGESSPGPRAAELEHLKTSVKLVQAQLATLKRQVAQQKDILQCTQADLHQARTELLAVEEAREQLATVQRHLDELQRSLPGLAAEAADAIRQGWPESASKVAALQEEVASAKKELCNAHRCWQAAEAGQGGTGCKLDGSRRPIALELDPRNRQQRADALDLHPAGNRESQVAQNATVGLSREMGDGARKLLRIAERLSREVTGLAQENGAQRTAAARMFTALQDAAEQVACSSASLRRRLERNARLAISQRDNEAREGVLRHLTAVEGILDALQASAWSSLSLGPEKQPGSLQQHYNRALRRAGIEADSQLVSDVAEGGVARMQKVEEELQQLINSIVGFGSASGLLRPVIQCDT